ncbi:hypothetical protein ASPZODRAFT_137253 [Penicilliopsis zonata CBS 506.65]|uniref:CBM-cenC domain-containing protein n=1 Tax=Penicilliopsis zonata CBS 506.65 TaxID=1073090 RepID=A0A1L9S5M2_9EURO|nr:hypothetical protein ASPZODRAFT_137253 [Penicilliopsis zonata CBS 506.65]OJJ42439.1 hypothetical protein ASPZODRAFT_137253 [Penicilliopsis zonata CBS 506.65]
MRVCHPLLSLWLLALQPISLLTTAAAEIVTSTSVSCESIENNALQNPSFETGELSPWTTYAGTGVVVSDTTDNGDYVLEAGGASTTTNSEVFTQQMTGLEIGYTYTAAYDYAVSKLATVSSRMECSFEIIMDSISGTVVANAVFAFTPVNTAWNTLSGTFTATSTEHTFYMYSYCTYGVTYKPTIRFDNAKFLGPPVESCTTVTMTSTVAVSTSSPASSIPSTSFTLSIASIPSSISSIPSSTPSISSKSAPSSILQSSSPAPPSTSSILATASSISRPSPSPGSSTPSTSSSLTTPVASEHIYTVTSTLYVSETATVYACEPSTLLF